MMCEEWIQVVNHLTATADAFLYQDNTGMSQTPFLGSFKIIVNMVNPDCFSLWLKDVL